MAPICLSLLCVLRFTGSLSKGFCSVCKVGALSSVVRGRPVILQGVKAGSSHVLD